MITRPVVAAVLGVVALWSLPSNAAALNTTDPGSAIASSAELRLPRIKGTVGPGMTIDVSPRRADAGRYRLVVQDYSTVHNWHIKGPNLNRRTSVAGTGRTIWRVRFAPGTYRIRCDPHPTTMRTRLVID